MTIREMADFTGKTERTIQRWMEKACDILSDEAKEGIKQKVIWSMNTKRSADYTIDEVETILSFSSMSKDAVRILMENARKPIATLEVQTAPNQMDVLFAFMERQQQVNQDFMKTVLSELKTMKQPLQIEQIKEDFYSLAAYCAINGMKINRSEMAIHGRELKKICGSYGAEIHSIPDERWGKVNSYPVEILKEYFSV